MRVLIEFLLGCPFWSIISQFGCEERVHSSIPPLNWKLEIRSRRDGVKADQSVVCRWKVIKVCCSLGQSTKGLIGCARVTVN